MTIPVTCGQCFASFQIKEQFAGKTIRCKSCGAPMPVVADAGFSDGGYEPVASRPRKRSRKKQPSAAPKIVAIVLGSLCLVALIGVGIWFLVTSTGKPEEPKNSEKQQLADTKKSSENPDDNKAPVLDPRIQVVDIEWKPDPSLLDELGPVQAFGPYEIRLPKGMELRRSINEGGNVFRQWRVSSKVSRGLYNQIMTDSLKLNEPTTQAILEKGDIEFAEKVGNQIISM